MAFVTLEDMTGSVESLVFPRVFERYQGLLQEDEAVVISGKISVREEEAPKLLAERITRLDAWKPGGGTEAIPGPAAGKAKPPMTDAQLAAKAEKKLFLRLSRKDMDRAQALLALDAGEIPVYMHIPEEKMTLLCPRSAWSSGSDRTLERLKGEFGESNVVLK